MKTFVSQLKKIKKTDFSERQAFALLLGHRIEEIRAREGVLQKEMACRLGITQSAYSRLVRGKSQITVFQLWRIASKLRVNPSEFIPRE